MRVPFSVVRRDSSMASVMSGLVPAVTEPDCSCDCAGGRHEISVVESTSNDVIFAEDTKSVRMMSTSSVDVWRARDQADWRKEGLPLDSGMAPTAYNLEKLHELHKFSNCLFGWKALLGAVSSRSANRNGYAANYKGDHCVRKTRILGMT